MLGDKDGKADGRLLAAQQAVTDYTRAVADDLVDGRDGVAEVVIEALQEQFSRLTATFGKLAGAKTPMDVARIYTEFLLDAAQHNARQLVQCGQLVAQANSRAWAPFTSMRGAEGDGRSDEGTRR